MTKRKDFQKLILKLTDGLLETAVDLVLWLAYFEADVLINPQGRLVWPHARAADKQLAKNNYQALKSALAKCRTDGLIARSKKRKIAPQLTAVGQKRLETILPFYNKDRAWEKRVYLITYDIPESKRVERNVLRNCLKRRGCAMLQQSVWLTPYNPHEFLQDFISQNEAFGTIIISDIGPDGSIGDEDLKSLLARLYKLEELNKRYKEFIKNYQRIKSPSFAQINFAYLSILNDDPQLPFELLPRNWLGDKAYNLYNNYTT